MRRLCMRWAALYWAVPTAAAPFVKLACSLSLSTLSAHGWHTYDPLQPLRPTLRSRVPLKMQLHPVLALPCTASVYVGCGGVYLHQFPPIGCGYFVRCQGKRLAMSLAEMRLGGM